MRTVVAPVCAFAHGWDKGPAGSRAVVRNKAPNHLERTRLRGLKISNPKRPGTGRGARGLVETTRLI
jgi:hypothetical protein